MIKVANSWLKEINISRYSNPKLLSSYVDKRVSRVERFLVKSFVKPGFRVLDVGCGSGGLLVELSLLGAKATGLDFSATMLDIARQRLKSKGLKARLVLGDIARFKKASFFDMVVMFGNVFSLIPGCERSLVLRQVYDCLKPDGLFLFNEDSTFYPDVKTWFKMLWDYLRFKPRYKQFRLGDVILEDYHGKVFFHLSNPLVTINLVKKYFKVLRVVNSKLESNWTIFFKKQPLYYICIKRNKESNSKI